MGKEYPWYRAYSADLLNEGKLARIAYDAGRTYAEVVGAWMLVLSMANESPWRGRLLVSAAVLASEWDVTRSWGLPPDTATAIFNAFINPDWDMLGTIDGVITVLHWDDRQPSSDGTGQSRKENWRKNKTGKNQSQPSPANVPNTSPDGPSHVPGESQDSVETSLSSEEEGNTFVSFGASERREEGRIIIITQW